MVVAQVFLVTQIAYSTSIDPGNQYGYGANTGWAVAADLDNGLVIGQSYCSGYIYSANVGWINCGDATPDNAIAYSNTSEADFGLNHDGFGNITGLAYSANIGWIIFEQTFGKPKVNLATGYLSGFAWSPNAGWMEIDSIRTLLIHPGSDLDLDNIPDSWELIHAGNLTELGTGDFDGDGENDFAEYEGNTNPKDRLSYTRITAFESDGSSDWITWTVDSSRLYLLLSSETLGEGANWLPVSSPFIPGGGPYYTEEVVGPVENKRFYRVEVNLPLNP